MAKIKNRWFLPTNTDNLKMMVAQGLITSPDGFSPNKYYKDELENYPGYIPLFKNNIPQQTLDLVISEQDNMQVCLIEIDLTKITGSAKNQQNERVDINIDTKEDLLLLQAPLPLSCIKQIIFKSVDDKKSLDDEQNLSSNFILADLKTGFSTKDEKLFKVDNTLYDNKKNTTITTDKAIDYPTTYALGGLLANLFYFAKNGQHSNNVYESFCNFDKERLDKDKLCVYQYFYSTDESNDLHTMYNKLLKKIVNGADFKNDVIVLLESDNWDERLKPRTQELAKMLRAFENNDTSISQKFTDAKKPLERLLLMLFHQENSENLSEYQLDFFKEEDYLLFALVFGARDKFIKSPKFIRECQDLQNFISFKMAEYAHLKSDSAIEFKRPNRVKTVWDILNTQKTGKKSVEKLAIKNCFQTVISGDYQHQGNKNIYKGFVDPKYEIVGDEYFKTMSKKNIDSTTYNDLAKLK
ncbi:MAG: hypothetical protein HFP81_04745 [Methylococcales symbiont of Hymedesmia sp. n. MRB-2018]|nr:MAG: hypothetical protein HFP81_04745 [Methylococcales symbiont of Hymedesmia sp. n. MRB-2018]